MFNLMGGGLLCAASGLVLLIVATATDFWMQYRYSGNLSNQGLWRFCVGNKCHPHTITLAFWDATRAFMLLSILSSFAGIILGLTIYSSSARSTRTRSAGITLLIAGLFALLGISVYTGVTVSFYGKRYAEWRFSWSYILGWIAVILTISAGVFHICAVPRNSSSDGSDVASG
ncbi:lens fiber membrane intrinsic protein-like [Podarcis muralis]|uniref:Lens fiber membrane intrinsic protein-like n=1 Tax=Podarcis muralis TaxID=64176 RepID=A0A670JUY5_PODMU|nr:lens fiber membrane intrinsic protein-like [Podarcis muralis]XP_053225317.1 lens fiber membrane intrinsic protein-like [Podarcis raffonei]